MYILVTNLDGFWDNIPDPGPWYPNRLIRPKIDTLRDGAEAVFIKIDGRRIERAWTGRILRIRPQRQKERVCFDVDPSRKLSDSEVREYQDMYREATQPGWHEVAPREKTSDTRRHDMLFPPFFSELEATADFRGFEDLVHKLLRLLGIHRAYQLPPDDQAGKPDGFFKFMNLAVIYDATLASDFEERKKQQVTNYAHQLLHGHVDIPPNNTELVGDHQKQVWIITRGRSRVLRNIGDTDSVTVKEVGILDLKQLYLDRLLVALLEDELENRLKNMGQA